MSNRYNDMSSTVHMSTKTVDVQRPHTQINFAMCDRIARMQSNIMSDLNIGGL